MTENTSKTFYLSADTFNSIETNFIGHLKNFRNRLRKFNNLFFFSITEKIDQKFDHRFILFFSTSAVFKQFHSTFNNCFFKKI